MGGSGGFGHLPCRCGGDDLLSMATPSLGGEEGRGGWALTSGSHVAARGRNRSVQAWLGRGEGQSWSAVLRARAVQR